MPRDLFTTVEAIPEHELEDALAAALLVRDDAIADDRVSDDIVYALCIEIGLLRARIQEAQRQS